MLDPSEVEKIIFSYLAQAKSGVDKENPKLDFKRKWYNLKDKEDQSEFLKDTTAMANTVGLDGFIVIGFDDKEKKFYPSSFQDSGLKDPNELTNFIVRHIDRPMEVRVINTIYKDSDSNDEFPLSILHIPPSIDKPHVIRNYLKNGKPTEHAIFVRKNSETHKPTKYDLEFMYYDRKNIVPEYEVYVNIEFCNFFNEESGKPYLNSTISIENTGKRPIQVKLMIITFEHTYFKNPISFFGTIRKDGEDLILNKESIWGGLNKFNLDPNSVREENLALESGWVWHLKKIELISNIKITIMLVNGKVINANVYLMNR